MGGESKQGAAVRSPCRMIPVIYLSFGIPGIPGMGGMPFIMRPILLPVTIFII